MGIEDDELDERASPAPATSGLHTKLITKLMVRSFATPNLHQDDSRYVVSKSLSGPRCELWFCHLAQVMRVPQEG